MKPHFVFLKLRFAFVPCNNFLPLPKNHFFLLTLSCMHVCMYVRTLAVTLLYANKYNLIIVTASARQLIDQILCCARALSFTLALFLFLNTSCPSRALRRLRLYALRRHSRSVSFA